MAPRSDATNMPKHRLTTLGVNHHYLCWQELWQKRYNDDEVEVSGIIASMLGLYRKQNLDLSLAELEYIVFPPYSVIERKSNISSNEATTEAVFGHQKVIPAIGPSFFLDPNTPANPKGS